MTNVEPYKTTLSQGNAYWMAKIAKEIYKSQSDHPKDNHTPDKVSILTNLQKEDKNFIAVFPISKNSAQAALIQHKDYFCLAFRGTDESLDWLDNLNMFSEKVLFGEFHRGFWNSVKDIWDYLYNEFNALNRFENGLDKNGKILYKKLPLFLTGHSLGGAMATIAAARLIHLDVPFTSVYTFGQPRSMTLATSRIFNLEAMSRFFRFQNNNDIVTRIPARLMGYSHVGSDIYIDVDKTLQNDPGFWFRFLDMTEGAFESFTDLKKSKKVSRLDAIADHDMEEYLNAVTKWDCAWQPKKSQDSGIFDEV